MAFQSKKTNKKDLSLKIVMILSSLLVLSSVGTLVGTYSWYEYKARAGLDFHGTAVGDATGLDVGLYSQYVLYDAKKYNLVEDENRNGLYWSTEKGLSSEALIYYSYVNNYAGNVLQPVTSGKYKRGDKMFLNDAPTKLVNYDTTKEADTRRYVRLPLAFRIKGSNQILDGQKIVLSNVEFDGEGNIKYGLRIHINNITDRFILNPCSVYNGYDTVGGVLDLDLDGYYDYFEGKDGTKKEYFYGESANEVAYTEPEKVVYEPIKEEDRNTFNGVTKLDVQSINFEQTMIEKAEYLGTKEVVNKMPLGIYDSLANAICVNMSVYAEGWSPFVSFTGRRETQNFFNLTMDFELWGA